MRILLIEDSPDIAANIGEYLEQQRVTVDYAFSGPLGLRLALEHACDVIVLDLHLPGLDGLSVCSRLRREARRYTPVLMLTSRDATADKLAGFEAGADDYLTKPFALEELHARLKVLASRAKRFEHPVLQVADLHYDTASLVVQRGGRTLDVTPSGLRLLAALMRASPAVLSRAELEQQLWGDNPRDSDSALRLHIHALRAAIDQHEKVKLLQTVHGIGYRLTDDAAAL